MQGWLKLDCSPVFYHLFEAFTDWKTEEYKSFAQSIPTEKQNEIKKKLRGSRQFWVQFYNTVPADPTAHCYPNGNFVSSSPQPLLPPGSTFPTPIFCGFWKSADQKINLPTKSPHRICFQEVQEVT